MSQDKSEEEQMEELKGTIITIMGVPVDDNPARLQDLVENISEVALKGLKDVEVSHLPNVLILTAKNITLAPDAVDLTEAPYNTPIGRASASIMYGAMETLGHDEDKEEEARWNALTHDQQEAEQAAYRARFHRYHVEAVQEYATKRTNEIRHAFDVAQKWAVEPDLTPVERCHGVAHELYSGYGLSQQPHIYTNTEGVKITKVNEVHAEGIPGTAGDAYGRHYDAQFSERIKDRSIRSAKALFGG